MPTERNFTGIQFEAIRRDVDPKYNAVHDDLTRAYYQFWKRGLSCPFQGYDVQATPAESKALFDKLHGLIWQMQQIALAAENEKRGRLYAELDSEQETINARGEMVKVKPSQVAQARVVELEAQGIRLTVK